MAPLFVFGVTLFFPFYHDLFRKTIRSFNLEKLTMDPQEKRKRLFIDGQTEGHRQDKGNAAKEPLLTIVKEVRSLLIDRRQCWTANLF